MRGKLAFTLVLILGPSAGHAMPAAACGEIGPTAPGPGHSSPVERVATRIPVLLGEICRS